MILYIEDEKAFSWNPSMHKIEEICENILDILGGREWIWKRMEYQSMARISRP